MFAPRTEDNMPKSPMTSYIHDAEFGLQMLHAYFASVLQTNHSDAVATVFQYALAESFPLEERAVSDVVRYLLCIFCAACINFGALFFVALKGYQRGEVWQSAFLRACAGDWMSDVLFVSVLEVLIMQAVLPSCISSAVARVRCNLQALTVQYVSVCD